MTTKTGDGADESSSDAHLFFFNYDFLFNTGDIE